MPHLPPAQLSRSRAATCCQGPQLPNQLVTLQLALVPMGSCLPGVLRFPCAPFSCLEHSVLLTLPGHDQRSAPWRV